MLVTLGNLACKLTAEEDFVLDATDFSVLWLGFYGCPVFAEKNDDWVCAKLWRLGLSNPWKLRLLLCMCLFA